MNESIGRTEKITVSRDFPRDPGGSGFRLAPRNFVFFAKTVPGAL